MVAIIWTVNIVPNNLKTQALVALLVTWINSNPGMDK